MARASFQIRKLQPLRPAVLHILITLSEGDRHGYAVKQDVEERTDGVVKMGPGTLYESIQRMLENGLIRESPRRPQQDEQSQRRYYRITAFGRRVLQAEVARLEETVAHARSCLRDTEPA